jgi:hypothetical protein
MATATNSGTSSATASYEAASAAAAILDAKELVDELTESIEALETEIQVLQKYMHT